jgi:uncharacterized protein YjdB
MVARLALGLALLTGSACQIITGPRAQKVALTIAPPDVEVGQSIQASAVAQKENGNPMPQRPVGYKSSDPSIATVSATGVITGIAPGTVTITASSDGKSASQSVTVRPPTTAAVLVTPAFYTLRIGGAPVRLTASPVDAQGRPIPGGGTVRWESSNSAVATVSSDGTVTGLAPGNVNIIAEVGGRQSAAQITVTPLPVSNITLAPNPLSVLEGATNQLVVTLRDTANRVIPSVGRNIVYVSNDQTIAQVSQSGVVQGNREGSTTIVATVDGSIRGEATVNVTQRNVAFVIFTSVRNPFFRLGLPGTVTAVAVDSNQAPIPNRLITYVSRNAAVLTVTANGGQVTPVNIGATYIVATAGGKSDSVLARVTEIPIASVTLTPLQPTVTGGQTIQFQATLRDQLGNIVTGRQVEWATNNPALINVSQTGLVTTAVSNGGTGAVTATVDVVPGFAEKIQGTAGVTVLPTPVASISVTPNPISLRQGASIQITVTMRDANGTEIRGRLFVAESSDPNVVQIDASRSAIVGVNPGTATVTVQAVNALNQKEGPITTVSVTITPPTGTVANRAPAAARRIP